MYTLYGSPSSRAFRVLWMLEELELPFEFVPSKPRSDEVLALNPSGKIPVLRDGEAVLTDSTAILTYLADKHGKLTHPAGSVARAHQDALTHTVLYCGAMLLGYIIPGILLKRQEDGLRTA